MLIDEEVYLEHYGKKGMKWGVRNNGRSSGVGHDGPDGVSAKVNRSAKKDASEFARAKSFYGEGAGTRRKLIKQTVEAKSIRVPGYKKAFDHHLDKQDQSKHASKAVTERKRTDRKENNKKRISAIARQITGEMGTQAAFVALVAAGAAFMRSERGQAVVKQYVSKAYVNQNKKIVTDFFKKNM